LNNLSENFKSSQTIKNMLNADTPNLTQIYENSEQALQDIQRMIFLEDFSGIKRRVAVLTTERLCCNEIINN